VWATYNLLSVNTFLSGQAWKYEAIVGMIANAIWESGMNPWRYNSIGAYGLVQFYPSTYYIGGVGVSKMGYAPSTSPTASGDGADATDGIAQLLVIDDPNNTKWLHSQQRVNLANSLGWNITQYNTIDDFKQITNADEALKAFLIFYEYPSSTVSGMQNEYNNRAPYIQVVEDILNNIPPTPPVPPTPTIRRKMPLYFYTTKMARYKKGILSWQLLVKMNY
jgi:hypothetical protein